MTSVHFSKFSDELLIQIFQDFDIPDLAKMRRVNKRFRNIADDNTLWKEQLRKLNFNLPFSTSKPMPARDLIKYKVSDLHYKVRNIRNKPACVKAFIKKAQTVERIKQTELMLTSRDSGVLLEEVFKTLDPGNYSPLEKPSNIEEMLMRKEIFSIWSAMNKGFFTEIFSLYLVESSLSNIPTEIKFFINMETLRLSFNQLNILPEEIGKCQALRELYLDENEFAKLPDALLTLTNLTKLNAASNYISEIDDNFSKLSNLTEINLERNHLLKFPNMVTKCVNLRSLSLSHMFIQTVPKEISECRFLTDLDLSYNKIKELPNEITQLTNLQVLLLDGNSLKKLPKAITRLTSLRNLDLGLYQRANILAHQGFFVTKF